MNHLMLDIETLSTRSDAAVVAIGVVVFDEDKIIESAHWPLTMADLSGHIDPKTIAWWFDQLKEAQQITFGGERVKPWKAATELYDLVKKYDIKTVWANDPHFDVVILQNWWERYTKDAGGAQHHKDPCITWPWPFVYNQPRSYRTMKEISSEVGFTEEMRTAARGNFMAHSAVDDAASQARAVIAMKKYILNGGVFQDSPFIRKPVGSWA